MREVRNACIILVTKRKGNAPLGRLVTDGQNNTILDLKWAVCVRAFVCVCERGLDTYWSNVSVGCLGLR